MSKEIIKEEDNIKVLNEMLDGFDNTIGNSISITQKNLEILLSNESAIKQILEGENIEDLQLDCKEVKNVIKSLVGVILSQKRVNQETITTFEIERENANQMNEQLIKENEILQTDQLTQLGNRHAFNKYLSQLSNNFIENNKIFSFAIIDIDDFKKINDRYGHANGDGVLKYLAQFLAKNIPDNSEVFRFGGEEFVILMEGNRLGLKEPLEEILEKLNKTTLTTKNKKVKIKISFSAGVTSINNDDEHSTNCGFEDMYDRADAFLYEVKKAGKNAVK